MTVSMRVMSAGDGYRYLLASVTAGDVACHVPWLIVNYAEKGCLIAQQSLPARSSRADGRRKVRQLVKAAWRRAAEAPHGRASIPVSDTSAFRTVARHMSQQRLGRLVVCQV